MVVSVDIHHIAMARHTHAVVWTNTNHSSQQHIVDISFTKMHLQCISCISRSPINPHAWVVPNVLLQDGKQQVLYTAGQVGMVSQSTCDANSLIQISANSDKFASLLVTTNRRETAASTNDVDDYFCAVISVALMGLISILPNLQQHFCAQDIAIQVIWTALVTKLKVDVIITKMLANHSIGDAYHHTELVL